MKLSLLLSGAGIPATDDSDCDIVAVTPDSREAGENTVFVCIDGAVCDGHNYARSAYDRGCRVLVVEKNVSLPPDAQILYVPDTRIALAKLSDVFYKSPSKNLKIIGITGTKGKTTTAELINAVLNRSGLRSAYIGTKGVVFNGTRYSTLNTTPESCEIQRYMRDMVNSGIKYLVMEVSSQALYFNRVYGIKFDTCVFTNLSPDHISPHEHPSFEHYMNCKHSLFTDYGAKFAVYNADDPYSGFILDGFDGKSTGFSIHKKSEYSADSIRLIRGDNFFGTSFTCITHGRSYDFFIPMPDDFSVYNALGAIAVCHHYGVKYNDIISTIRDIKIDGRFETVKIKDGVTAVIDYAHNGVSLASALGALRKYNPGRIICLFGSVGGRTQMRRAELGKVAAEMADFCILTSDNPDNEPPENIIADIEKQFSEKSCPHISIPDRRKAIAYAVGISQPGDVILLAGKGHECYQLISGHKEHFNEREILIEQAKLLKSSKINTFIG